MAGIDVGNMSRFAVYVWLGTLIEQNILSALGRQTRFHPEALAKDNQTYALAIRCLSDMDTSRVSQGDHLTMNTNIDV